MTDSQRRDNETYKAALAMLESIGITVLLIENNREDRDICIVKD